MTVDRVLFYWFGEPSLDGEWEYRGGLWWSLVDKNLSTPGISVDQLGRLTVEHIAKEFAVSELISSSVDEEKMVLHKGGILASWVEGKEGNGDGVRGKVAAVVALTQFTRAALGFTKQSAVSSCVAQEIAVRALEESDGELPWPFTLFLLTSLLQSDDGHTVKRAVQGFKRQIQTLSNGSPAQIKVANKLHAVMLKRAVLRLHTVARFGRNPHLNSAFGRQSTAEEEEYIKQTPSEKWEQVAPKLKFRKRRLEDRAAKLEAVPGTAVENASQKLRILVLHGRKQTASAFEKKTRKAFAELSRIADLVFLDAPHAAGEAADESSATPEALLGGKVWFSVREQGQTVSYDGLEASLSQIEEFVRLRGPFHGVLGFSQGGCLAALLAALQAGCTRPAAALPPLPPPQHLHLSFVITISSPPPRDARLELPPTPELELEPAAQPGLPVPVLSLPSFHVWGDADAIVSPSRSRALAALFADSHTATHPAGHFSPGQWSGPVHQICEWLATTFPALVTRDSPGPLDSGLPAPSNAGRDKAPLQPCPLDGGFRARVEWQLAAEGFDLKQKRFPFPVGGYNNSFPKLLLPEMKLRPLLDTPFWHSLLHAGQAALLCPHSSGLQPSDAEAFVSAAFALAADRREAAEEVAALAAALYPLAVAHRSVLEQETAGQVGLWLWWALHAALQRHGAGAGAEGGASEKENGDSGALGLEGGEEGDGVWVELLSTWAEASGEWRALQRLDLLAVTGQAVRTGVLAEQGLEPPGPCQCLEVWESARGGHVHTLLVRLLAGRLLEDYRRAVDIVGTGASSAEADVTADGSVPWINPARRDQIKLPSRAASSAPRLQSYTDKVTRLATHVAAVIAEQLEEGGAVQLAEGDVLRLPRGTPLSSATKAFISRRYRQALAPSLHLIASPLMDDQRRFRDAGAQRQAWKRRTAAPPPPPPPRPDSLLPPLSPAPPASASALSSRAEQQAAALSAQLQTLLAAPLSARVLFPEPEPVDIAAASEFAPLHAYLRAQRSEAEDAARSLSLAAAAPIGDEELHFTRGALCGDGRLDLCKQVIGPAGIGPLMESLALDSVTRKAVNSVLLGNNIAGNDLGRAVADMILGKGVPTSGEGAAGGPSASAEQVRVQPTVEVWYIAGNRLTAEGVLPVLEALHHDKVVTQLWLKRNPLGSGAAVEMAAMLRVNTRLQVLDLTNCGILDEGVEALCGGLRGNATLQHLYLGGNGISVAGTRALATLVAGGGCGLRGLLLACNRVGDEGVRELCDAMGGAAACAIERLDLSSCAVGPHGARHLARLLRSPAGCGVRHLRLGFDKTTAPLDEVPNKIGAAGVQSIADALRHAPAASKLYSLVLTHSGGWAAEDGEDGRLMLAALEEFVEAVCAAPTRRRLVSVALEAAGPYTDLLHKELQATLALNRAGLTPEELAEAAEAINPQHLAQVQSVYRLGGVYED